MKPKILIYTILFLILSVNMVTAQKKNRKVVVTGQVVDALNKPVPGAIILIDNENTPSYTDNNGFYEVKVKAKAELIAVFVKPNRLIEKPFNGQATINFTLSDTLATNNPILNEGYFRGLAGTNYVKMDDPNKLANESGNSDAFIVSDDDHLRYNDIYEMIQGRIPGVDVRGKRILIRGQNRMGDVGNEAFFVVDGMPVNSIDHVTPAMVKAITFLKGTEAAVYGSQGANGVVVIEIKKAARTAN